MSDNSLGLVVGQQIRIIPDKDLFKKIQMTNGGYSEIRMSHLPGKTVVIRHVDKGIILVEKNGAEYYLHPDTLEEVNMGIFSAVSEGVEERIYEAITTDNLNIRDYFGRTPIHLACELGKLGAVKCINQFGPDLKISDEKNFIPVQTCAIKGHYHILDYLISHFRTNRQELDSMTKLLNKIAETRKDQALRNYLQNKKELTAEFLDSIDVSTPKTVSIPQTAVNSLESRLQDIPENLICKICTLKEKSVALVDCGHVFCMDCSIKFFDCPYCRKEVIDRRFLKFRI